MTPMVSGWKYLGLLASTFLTLAAALPGVATADQPEAILYEVIENLDTAALVTTGHRISFWTAQGTAQAGSPFCPLAVAAALPGAAACTITAFGMDHIDLSRLETSVVVGNVWANIVAVVNPVEDNPVDGPEAAAFSGQITGDIQIAPTTTLSSVTPELGKNKSLLGPALPLIYVTNGKFFADARPTVRTQPGDPPMGVPATFDATFRLPFKVTKMGRVKPERGTNAYYLADNGSLIKVDRQDEFAMGFPLLRAEVFFR
jgi:hypothetical protein